jgi:predicted permease
MFLNYLKIALRNIRRHKGFTFINIIGLAISLGSCMLIGLWILNEMSYDKHYIELDRIQAILINDNVYSPNALGPFLQENVPEIQYAARITHGSEALVNGGSLYSFEEILAADPAIIEIFSFPFMAGDSRTALAEPKSIIITKAMASKFFPDQTAVGKTLLLNNKDIFTVTGVIENIPPNSIVKFDFLVPIDYQRQRFLADGFEYDAWNLWSTKTYAKTRPGMTSETLTEKISGMIQEHYEDEEVALSAINISDVYLKFSETKTTIKVFSAIAIAILIMACINFINLSTARYKVRARETGIRKIIGSHRISLIMQFLGESALLMIIGFILALILVEAVLPFFNSLFGLQLSLGLLYNIPVIIAIVWIIGITALLSGIYPAMILSRFHPVQVLKNNINATNRNINLRRVLVVIQFSLTAILIIGTAIIFMQVKHIKSKDVGYDKEHVINIRLKGESHNSYDAIKTELQRNPDILSVTGGMGSLPYWHISTTAQWDGLDPDEEKDVHFNFIKYDFTRTFGIELVEGRDFDKDFGSDERGGCVINESLARLMNQSPILGSRINIWDEDRKVIGVMKDFNFQPLSNGIEPLALIMPPEGGGTFSATRTLSIRISPNNISSTLDYIERTWKNILPDYPFEYSFLDEQFDVNYKSLEQTSSLAGCFGLLAVSIAALGLFGLASYTAEQRTREIGIRKVLGASISNIVRMMSREYIILVVISNLVAWPAAWFMMNKWLEIFAYRVDIGPGIFVMVGSFTLVVALFSVGYQSFKAARTDPAITIRYE